MENHDWIFVVLGLFVLGVFALGQLAGILRSVQRTEAMLASLLARDGVQWGEAVEPSAKVKELALNPRTYVEAIKAYREQTGLDLREAKAVIDRLARVQQPAG
jgi:ribosomal protein L7/L12